MDVAAPAVAAADPPASSAVTSGVAVPAVDVCLGHLLRSADFERVLASSPRARSTHFALHHLAVSPSVPGAAARQRAAAKLSTGDAPGCPPPVDDAAQQVPIGRWLGTVVPKRHARRSVTRSLLKRQMRAVMHRVLADRGDALPRGLWVLRLKAPFDVKQFPSAASDALRACARDELRVLFDRFGQPQRPRSPARATAPAAPDAKGASA